MTRETTRPIALKSWRTVLGDNPTLGDQVDGRDLWPATGEDGTNYMLKRLGPWRNYPLADEIRMHRHLLLNGIPVADFLVTDAAAMFAGSIEESYVLMPKLPNAALDSAAMLTAEPTIGDAMAELHYALAGYPQYIDSYTEDIAAGLRRDLMLPCAMAERFDSQRDAMIAALSDLPGQRIHGDLTPENILLTDDGDVAGFIDFDHLPHGPRLWDIGKYLSRRIRQRWRGDVTIASADRLQHLVPFLGGYHASNPLRPREIAALPAAIAAANIMEVDYYQQISAGTLERRRLPDHNLTLADTIEAAIWQLDHAAEVDRVVAALLA